MGIYRPDEALVGLGAAKEYVQIGAQGATDDGSRDALVEVCVKAASSMVSNHCFRRFARTTYEALLFDGTGAPEFRLGAYPVTALDATPAADVTDDETQVLPAAYKLELDTQRDFGSGSTLTYGDDYVVYLNEDGMGRVRRIAGVWPDHPQCIRVTFQAGYAENPPRDVAMATLRLVGELYNIAIDSRHGKRSVTMPGGTGTLTFTDLELPKDVRTLLAPYVNASLI